MNIKLKMLKAWTHKPDEGDEIKANAGDVVEVSKELAADLLLDGTAKRYDEAEEKAAADAKKAEREETVKALAEAIKEGAKDDKGIRVTYMHEKSDDDPFHGFCPGYTGGTPTEHQKRLALGVFAAEVFASKDAATPLLAASKARAEAQIKSAKEGKILSKAALDGLQAQNDTDVGYLMPPALSMALMGTDPINAVVRPRASLIPMTTQSVDLPRTNGYDKSGGLVHGGVVSYWTGEDKQLSATKSKVENIEMKLKKLTTFTAASHESMRFAPLAVGSYLMPQMQDSNTFAQDSAYIGGTGAGQPQGITGSGAALQIDAEDGQAAATITYPNVLAMVARLKIFRDSSVVWLANRTTMPQLAQMSLTVGTGGAPVWLPANGAAGMPFQTLMGYPIVYTEYCQALGTVGDIMLCDLSRYLIADDSAGPELTSSIHLKYDYAQECFRLITYTDGQAADRTAYTPKNGDTLGVFVKLATRS